MRKTINEVVLIRIESLVSFSQLLLTFYSWRDFRARLTQSLRPQCKPLSSDFVIFCIWNRKSAIKSNNSWLKWKNNNFCYSPALIRKWLPFKYTNPRHDISAFFSNNFYLNETTRERGETETNLNSFRLSKRFFNSKIVSLFSLENQQDLHSVETKFSWFWDIVGKKN